MNRTERQELIRNHIRKLLADMDITVPPVPVDRIAKQLKAKVRYSPLDSELSGMIYVKDEVPIIGVNALHHPNRQRFTMAHELGHLLLHKDEITKQIHVDKDFPMLMRSALSSAGTDNMEVDANMFAAELLMPVEFLEEDLSDKSIDVDDDEEISALAKRYKVSPSAMRFRLGNLFE